MMYKIQKGKLITPPAVGTRHNGETVSGYKFLSKAELQADGWKELVIEPYPDEDKQYESYHEETDTEIVQKWREIVDVGAET